MTRKLAAVVPALALVAAFAAALPSASDQGPGTEGVFGEQYLRALVRFLDLSEDQIAQARTLREELRAALEPLLAEQRAIGDQLRELLASEDPDPAAVGELVLARHALAAQISALREDFEERFAALLDPEQLEKLEILKEWFAARRAIPLSRLNRSATET